MYYNNYFNAIYQEILIGEYNKIVENLLVNCDIKLNTDFIKEKILKYSKNLYLQE